MPRVPPPSLKSVLSQPFRVSDHVHQFKLALLQVGQDVDEGLVENHAPGQLADDGGSLWATRRRDIDLLGEADLAVLKGVQRVVGSHPHLVADEEKQERYIIDETTRKRLYQ